MFLSKESCNKLRQLAASQIVGAEGMATPVFTVLEFFAFLKKLP